MNTYHEIASAKRGQDLKKLLKPLAKYYPFVENGIMRLGGRLQRSDDMRHPIVLPRICCLTGLIVNIGIRRVDITRRLISFNELRERFYVGGKEKTVKFLIKSGCMACRSRRAMIGSLLSVRVKSGQRLFTVTGVDFIRPIVVKCNRKTSKRYCMVAIASRASHFEIAFDLTTASFLLSLRRFLAVRGMSTKII